MKRIRNIQDLEFEKLKLRVRQLELEKQMERSWMKLNKKLYFDEHSEKRSPNGIHFKSRNPFLSVALNYGASFLSHKLGMLAGKKIEGLAERVLENLSGKISNTISKKRKTY